VRLLGIKLAKIWIVFVLAGLIPSGIVFPQATVQNNSAPGRPGQGPVKEQAPPAALRVTPGAAPPYTLNAANCGFNAPVLVFSVRVTNEGRSPSPAPPAVAIHSVDSSLTPRWIGETSLPAINPGQSITVTVPVMAYSPTLDMGGNGGVTHIFRFLITGAPSYQGENRGTSTPLQIAVPVPAAFCMKKPLPPGQQKPKSAYQTGGSGNVDRNLL
jgi:hypothetical protein